MATQQQEIHDRLVTILDQTREALASISLAYGNSVAQLAQLLGVEEDDEAFSNARQMLAHSRRLDLILEDLVRDLR